ncbi:MAG: FAD-dependent oxidoreductase [Acidobacteria bacterium]|nr:FAD-dependent oxidoreductase [Acidobacteriota bacterium]
MDQTTVYVVGAGPAGLFAARKIASAGHQVLIFNRDIKPGGLAEYGIYPQKFHMKNGLRKQFGKILAMPNVDYIGNVRVRTDERLTIDAMKDWQPSAIVFAVGAQGTKRLGLPGEDAKGVYSAKDFVYHYNQLPPFASQDFSTGRRVAIIGMGNVMVDIARWLIIDQPGQKPDEVTVIARRGPFEVKFDRKEFDYVEAFLDRKLFQEELSRVAEACKAVGQDVNEVAETTFPWLKSQPDSVPNSKLTFRFLSSPVAIEPGTDGRIERLRVIENILVRDGENTRPKATDNQTLLDFDTLIFAIGDLADPGLGLPYAKNCYVTNSDPADPDRSAYEVFDPASGKVVDGVFVVGWARKASEGLVGKARFDAEHGVEHVLKFLESAAKKLSRSAQDIFEEIRRKGIEAVNKDEISVLTEVEAQQAKAMGLPEFKFSSNEEMLRAIEAKVAG